MIKEKSKLEFKIVDKNNKQIFTHNDKKEIDIDDYCSIEEEKEETRDDSTDLKEVCLKFTKNDNEKLLK